MEELMSPKDVVNSQVATPLAHALCLSRGILKDLRVRTRKHITKGLSDHQLGVGSKMHSKLPWNFSP